MSSKENRVLLCKFTKKIVIEKENMFSSKI